MNRWGILLCVGVLVGCRGEVSVEVSGKVARPGPVAYRADWALSEYVTAAGGFLEEADTLAAFLFRVPVDSTGEGRLDYGRSQRWALADVPEVLLPGDQIVVPGKTYLVRMDTVREVRNLDMHARGKTYRVEAGVLAPGWTDRGVPVAVVIGRGTVYEGERPLSPFHYLYFQMHPERYGEVGVFAGEAIKDREALEDARDLFRSLSVSAGGGIEVPEAGYFSIQAGVWLSPKSDSYPGPGMRKRRFSDGREWTTFPDGRRRMQYPDGKVVMDFPSGAQEARFSDGRISFTDVAGNVHTRFGNGREEWRMVSGNHMIGFADGRRVYRRVGGDVRTVFPDGTDRTEYKDGTLYIRYPDGRVEVTTPAGLEEVRHPDGRITAKTPDGHEVEVFGDGRRVSRLKDGTRIEVFPDGRRVQWNMTGERIERFPDGRRRVEYGDGANLIRRPDGTRQIRYADETVVEIFSDGREVQRFPDSTVVEVFPDGRRLQHHRQGERIEAFPDGLRIEMDAAGNRTEVFPDGRRKRTFSDPYAYRGTLRADLVTLTSLPVSVLPGEQLKVGGTAAEGVRSVSIAVFRLPEGDVQTVEVPVKQKRFQGQMKMEVLGFYRLQILADGGLSHLETSVDRMLKVGDPGALPAQVLETRPLVDPQEGAQRVVEMINRARRALGRRSVRADPILARTAEYRLSEMRALDYFSHASPTGKAAPELVRMDPGRFQAVGENLGKGPSLEDVHEQLMLSAGHRRNILRAGWTDVGVAVSQEGRTVWVVEVFAQP